MPEVIYVRGGIRTFPPSDMTIYGRSLVEEKWVWNYAHPRGPRFGNTTLTLFDYTEGKIKTWLNWDGSQPPGEEPNTSEELAPLSVVTLYDHIKSSQAR